MRTTRPLSFFFACVFCSIPFFLFSQHAEVIELIDHNEPELSIIFVGFEWAEYIADLVGIGILILGFLKGLVVFIKMEFDHLTGGDTFDDILALRSTLGGYIILSLDFLIISDIIHSVVKPEFNELINLGIIVVLRTSIGFFLGREIMELRHNDKMEKELLKKEVQKGEDSH
jgi:uncharacterized membrane protein